MRKMRVLLFLTVLFGACGVIAACAGNRDAVHLDPNRPVTVTVWHYYNGKQKVAFDAMVDEFNSTVGREKGIIVEEHNQGDVTQLEESVMAAVNKEAGSGEPPNIFASYADTAYAVDRMGMLADLEPYFTPEEQTEYVDSYIEEGRIGENGELKIFPIAKSTEVFMLNRTDWEPFAEEAGVTLEELSTLEGVAEVAEKYYEWSDSLTPDVPEDGKAFYGRDAFANLMIIGSRQLGCEIFQVENGKVTLHADREVMKRIWDTYYLPYINGYFTAAGRFRSDDVRVGEILALTGSTSSASYFPMEVTVDDVSHPITAAVLPAPVFKGGEKYAVQQGAGMVVMKGEKAEEYASVLFLKWLTGKERNLTFSGMSGYLPVKKDANDFSLLMEGAEKEGLDISDTAKMTIEVSFRVMSDYSLYTNKAFKGGTRARKVLENSLPDKAAADRAVVLSLIGEGMSREEAVARYDTQENFEQWFAGLEAELRAAVEE